MNDGKEAKDPQNGSGDSDMTSTSTLSNSDVPAVTRLRWNEVAHPRTATFATRQEAEKYKRGLEAMGFKVDIG
jgi:hypothetical protein